VVDQRCDGSCETPQSCPRPGRRALRRFCRQRPLVFRLADSTTGTQHDRPNGSLIALFYSLQSIANAPMQGVCYSVRSACMGSMEAAMPAFNSEALLSLSMTFLRLLISCSARTFAGMANEDGDGGAEVEFQGGIGHHHNGGSLPQLIRNSKAKIISESACC
jgi:hypothetical protein